MLSKGACAEIFAYSAFAILKQKHLESKPNKSYLFPRTPLAQVAANACPVKVWLLAELRLIMRKVALFPTSAKNFYHFCEKLLLLLKKKKTVIYKDPKVTHSVEDIGREIHLCLPVSCISPSTSRQHGVSWSRHVRSAPP